MEGLWPALFSIVWRLNNFISIDFPSISMICPQGKTTLGPKKSRSKQFVARNGLNRVKYSSSGQCQQFKCFTLSWREDDGSSLLQTLRLRFFQNIPKRIWVSLLNRWIQNHSDHGASKEPKYPCPEWILWFLWKKSCNQFICYCPFIFLYLIYFFNSFKRYLQ